MDEDRFWAIIGATREEAGSDSARVARLLFRRLRVLGPAEVVEFVRWWERARSRLYSWPVTDAAAVLLGPVDEDDEELERIQDWIISYGRETVDRVARDPDCLAGLVADRGSARADSFEEFLAEAHMVVAGSWPPDYDPDGPDDLVGEQTDLGDPEAVRRRFPRLAALREE
ncbi:DUF4240 domain-containing protein [Paractinoplanes lichenicola]|uniref:DUF4240 domain-containing protein n=1 Tax=Paractinoplanes lichenicola TaxID=2802976 RepID=A0ABS1VLP2_9ACTN|nr:DUF4240 domain-containing protein [Actinoplanes lichenicola]MBL7255647.1 DUF4240 domain-containing protein [Actinoplanes lichenicola]